MANEEQEDLSQLKGPIPWHDFQTLAFVIGITVLAIGATLCIAMEITRIIPLGIKNQILLWGVIPVALIAALAVNIVRWWKKNHIGHPVWWWQGEDGKWRVTAKGYPEKALGLVIEVHVKAPPSFRIMWGSQRWWCAKKRIIIGMGWQGFLGNQAGELVAFYTPDNIPAGLSKEVVKLLCNTAGWRIVPLDAGRVLRFVDAVGIGMEFRSSETDADIEGILMSFACFEYRMGQRNSARDLRNERDKLRKKREETWQWMCEVLRELREQAKQASRPRTKVMVLDVISRIVAQLNEVLPPDHQFRRDYGVSAEELERVRHALTAEKEKGGKKESPSPSPSPTAGRGE